MNLVGTLAKVAIGTMVARGVGKMLRGGSSAGGSSGGLGGLLGGALGGGSPSQSGSGGLGGLLGGLAGGGSGQQQSGGGGLGGLLGSLAGGASAQQDQGGAGGLGGLLGSVLSGGGGVGPAGGGGAAGGLGGLLDSLGGGQQSGGGLGGMLNQAMGGQATPEPTTDQNAQAEIMLRAMINAAKSDGQIDQDEQKKILEHLGDVSQEEANFVRSEMAAPLNVDAFVASVPNGMEQQVYMFSLLGIQLDSQAEAQYLDKLAKGMGIAPQQANAIHEKIGVPALYS